MSNTAEAGICPIPKPFIIGKIKNLFHLKSGSWFKIADMKHNAQYIKYSENLTLEKDSVQLVYKNRFEVKVKSILRQLFENN